MGGHGGGDSFLLGEIDLWHAGVLASLPAVCMAPECPGKAEPVTAFCVFLSGHLNKVAISCCSQNSLFRLWKAKSALSSDNCPQHDFLFMCPLRNTQKAVRRLHLTRTPRRRTDRRACWKAFRKICAAVLVKYDRTDSANFVVKLIISQYRPKYKSLSALK